MILDRTSKVQATKAKTMEQRFSTAKETSNTLVPFTSSIGEGREK